MDHDIDDEQATVPLNFMIEIHFKDRVDPLIWPLRITVTENVRSIEEVMDHAHAFLTSILDSRSHDHILIVDPMYNHHMIMRDEIQSMSILAPDRDSLPWREDEEDDDDEG